MTTSTSTSNNILEIKNLTKQYPGFLLDSISLSIPKGSIIGLIGENGAGKSTTIKTALDLVHKDSGTITFWGQEISSSNQIKEDIGVVFDGINFYETLTPAKQEKSWPHPTHNGTAASIRITCSVSSFLRIRKSRLFPRV